MQKCFAEDPFYLHFFLRQGLLAIEKSLFPAKIIAGTCTAENES
jgi:hypothetical protein